ncbi:MAG: hypothetical protein ACRCX6_00750, partial [Plesiomonas shigelloides]
HINAAAMKALLLRHERCEQPLGAFLVNEGVISPQTLTRALELQDELQVSMTQLLQQSGLNHQQLQQLQQEVA